mgnify:CR=1 FL=1
MWNVRKRKRNRMKTQFKSKACSKFACASVCACAFLSSEFWRVVRLFSKMLLSVHEPKNKVDN